MEMKQHTDGETPKMARYIDTADVAKIVRKELKANFKGIKFTVRSSRYAGGSSIRVGWTDGPTDDQVNEIVGWMKGTSFDGMIDLQSYHDSVLDGENVHFGNSYIFTNRMVSADLFREAVAVVAADWGEDVNKFEIFESSFGAYFGGYETFGALTTMDVQRLVGEVLSETSVEVV